MANSLFIQAARKGDFKSLERIIQQSRSANSSFSVDDEIDDRLGVGGNTALMWAYASGNLSCVELLLQNGANIRRTNKIGWNALICAAEDGNESVVRLLLPSLIEHKDIYGNKALHWASFNGFHGVVRCRLQFGADFMEKNHFGQLPEQCAGRNAHMNISDEDKDLCYSLIMVSRRAKDYESASNQ
jgi:ankyrin repeat protein